MKDKIADALYFLATIWKRLFYFMILMLIITTIGYKLTALINMNIAIIILRINFFIGIIPIAIDTLLIIILMLINLIIYDEY